MKKENEHCAIGFIDEIWNNGKFDKLENYLHPGFTDFSLPTGLRNAAGLKAYLKELTGNINHKTTIQKLIIDQEFIILEVRIKLSAAAKPMSKQFDEKQHETITGYRILAMADQRIIGHWECFD